MEHKTLITKHKRQNEQEMDELCVHDCDFNRDSRKEKEEEKKIARIITLKMRYA